MVPFLNRFLKVCLLPPPRTICFFLPDIRNANTPPKVLYEEKLRRRELRPERDVEAPVAVQHTWPRPLGALLSNHEHGHHGAVFARVSHLVCYDQDCDFEGLGRWLSWEAGGEGGLFGIHDNTHGKVTNTFPLPVFHRRAQEYTKADERYEMGEDWHLQ